MKKLIFMMILCLTCSRGAFARSWLFCDNSGRCWLVDDPFNEGPFGTRSDYYAFSGCPPGQPWYVELLCIVPEGGGDGNGGYTDGYGNAINVSATQLIASELLSMCCPVVPSAELRQEFNAALLAQPQEFKCFVDASTFTPSVRQYLLGQNPPGYPPGN